MNMHIYLCVFVFVCLSGSLFPVQVHGTMICCGRTMYSPLFNVVIANKLVILVLTTAR